jgi:hypothetical protein
LGIKQDGSIAAWGHNYYGQCNVPSPNTDFVAVAAGCWHNLGLKQDPSAPLGAGGSIVAWGYNGSGQCNVPSPNTGFVAVAAGYYHSLGLKQDGSIVAWGNNDYGQCNVSSPNTGFTAVAAGWDHSLGIKQDGSIVAWGYNKYGQCNVPSPNTGFVAIAAGLNHSLGLKQDGSIVAWGDNRYGQCNVPSPNTGFIAITAGAEHNLAILSDDKKPVACIAGENQIVEANSNCEARVVLDGSCSSDEDSTQGTNDDINDFDWYEIIDPCDPNTDIYLGSGEVIECNLPLGEHTILLEVTDTAGASDSNGITVTVEDVTPPQFSLSVEPNVLWPVNHKMVGIVPTFTVSDNCDESPEVMLVSITVNDSNDSTGGGHTDDDIQIDEGNIYLRAERSGTGTGRIYTITYQAVDDSGNVSIDTAEVVVPHDQR